MSVAFEGALALVLLGFSGLFSGLTLGLLGLDVCALEITLASDSIESKYAEQILPLRRRGNLLLCTLLLANVAVNTALPILLIRLFGEIGSLLMSVSLIVIIGEIIPQAICSRNALLIGAHSLYLVYFLIALLFPVAYPISRMLDFVFGDELGQLYSRKELQKLVEMHHKGNHAQKLHKDEFNIMTGALQFGSTQVHEIMTPLSAIFSLGADALLDFQTMSSVFQSGYSRIPVMGRLQNGVPKVIGVLYAKDLIMVDPDDALPVRHILTLHCRTVHFVFSDTNLERMFSEFKSGRTHIAIVVDLAAGDGGDYEIRGLVTLEDITEVIFQDSIYDESDIEPATRQLYRGSLSGQPALQQSIVELPDLEQDVVCRRLRDGYPKVFQVIPEILIRELIQKSKVYDIFVPEFDVSICRGILFNKGGLKLYGCGDELSFFSLILDGRVHVERDDCESDLESWSVIGLRQLECDVERIQGPASPGSRSHPEAVDFSAYVSRSSRILCIDRETFRALLNEHRTETVNN